MKAVRTIALMLVLVIFFAGCLEAIKEPSETDNSPEGTVSFVLQAIKAGDTSLANFYLKERENSGVLFPDDLKKEERALVREMFYNLTWSNLNLKEKTEDTAVVSADISFLELAEKIDFSLIKENDRWKVLIDEAFLTLILNINTANG